MKTASISQAKNHLSAFLDAVRHGETVLILDRGRPVARLEPILSSGLEDHILHLKRQGVLRRPTGKVSAALLNSPPPQTKRSALEVLLEARSEDR